MRDQAGQNVKKRELVNIYMLEYGIKMDEKEIK